MKNLRQSIIFCDYIVRFYSSNLSTLFFCLNLCLAYIFFDILNNITDNLSIYSSLLQYKNFLVIDFINKLEKNLLIISLVISDFVK